MFVPYTYPHSDYIRAHCGNLKPYMERVKEKCWPDWQQIVIEKPFDVKLKFMSNSSLETSRWLTFVIWHVSEDCLLATCVKYMIWMHMWFFIKKSCAQPWVSTEKFSRGGANFLFSLQEGTKPWTLRFKWYEHFVRFNGQNKKISNFRMRQLPSLPSPSRPTPTCTARRVLLVTV